MAYDSPGRLQIVAETVALNGLMSGMYRSYVAGMRLRGDERVLELGPGSGALTKHLVPVLKGGGHLTIVDVTPEWIERLRRRYAGERFVDFVCADLGEAPLQPESYDVAVAHWMLHDVDAKKRPGVVAALAALLRPGGRLFVREPVKESHGMPAGEVTRLATETGLREVSVEPGKSKLAGPFVAAVFAKA